MDTFYKSFAITFFFISAVGLAPFSHAEEYSLSYGARLTEANGAPIPGQDGKLDLEVSFYNAGTGGSPIGASSISFPGTSIVEGVFQLSITLTPTEFHQVFQDPSTPVYIEVKDVKSGAVFPRQRFSVIPFALKTPVDNDTIVYNSDGKLTVGSTVGTVKQVMAGSGLTGGSITDSGTITVDTGTTGNKIVQLSDGKLPSVDGSNLSSVNAEKLQTRNVSAAVPVSGQVLKWSGSAWVPSSDLVGETGSGEANTASNVTSGSGVGLFKGKVSADLLFYSLSPGAGVTISLVNDDVVIASSITQYTDAMAKAATVADSITDSVTTIAPSQNAVYDALATKQPSVTTSTDLNLNSITTNAVNAITVNPGVSTGEIKLKELSVNGTNYVGLKAPGSITSDLTFTLPGNTGTNGQFLKTDGSGNLSWTDQASAPVTSVNTLTGAVTLTTTNITEGANLYYTDARAKTAAVGDAITDAVTDKAPSQNAVFDALVLKSATSHNHSGVYEPEGLSTDVVTTTKILNGAVTAAKIAGCSDTQILKMSGANWVCSNDANSGGTVTSVASGTGLTGGPITGTGTLSLATSGVTAGTYTKITVDTYGRATSGTTLAANDLPSSIDVTKIGSGVVDNTEFGYLDGVTSAVQTQFNGRVAGPASATDNAIARFDGTTGKIVQNSNVVIDDSGNMGINTTGPDRTLDVLNASSPQLRLTHTDGSVYSDIQTNSSGNTVITNTGTVVQAKLNNIYTGQIVLGGGDAGDKNTYLDFKSDNTYSSTSLRIQRTAGENGTGGIYHRGTGVFFIDTMEAAPIEFYTSNTSRMYIAPGGNVGIGTTSPGTGTTTVGEKLDVEGGYMRLGYSGGPYLNFYHPNAPAELKFTRIGSFNGNMMFESINDAYTTPATRLLIQATTGNVGIGTTSPAQKLSVAGTIESTSGGIKFPDGTIQTTSTITQQSICDMSLTGLTHCWKLNEGSGTTIIDSVGGINGTFSEAVSWSQGIVDNAPYFNGSTSNVSFNQSLVGIGGTNYSISVWFKSDLQDVARELLSQWTQANSGNSFYVGITGSNIRFTDSWPSIAIGSWSSANWHHIVYVSTSNNAYVYFDGALVATKGSALTYTGLANLKIGNQGEAQEYWSGRMNDVAIFNRSLSGSEVRSIYKRSRY